MTLESKIPFNPKSAPHNLRPVFTGAYDEKCSIRYFRDYLPDSWGCEEVSSEKKWAYHLRSFWYPEKSPSGSIQQKIQAFLFSMEKSFMPNYWGTTALVQFWEPVTTNDGNRTLSVSEQPFAVRENTKGPCRYRFYCQQLFRVSNGIEVGPDFGPVGRAFCRGSLEFSPQVDIYSEEDFPLKKHALYCGFIGYLAVPVFELGNGDSDGHQRSCVGVLEFVSFTNDMLRSFDTEILMKKLKKVGLAFRYPSHEAMTQIRPYFNFPPPQDACKGNPDVLSSLLDLVRKKYKLPLVQIWLPCICDGSEVSVECDLYSDSFSKVTHLVCGLHCLERDERQSVWLPSYARCDSQVYFVEDGESCVGRAFSLNKICFVNDIRQFSIADYPLVTLGHSSDLLACFAVPLQLVDPKLPPLVLEVFLPTQYNFKEDQGTMLKCLFSTFARELFKYNAVFELIDDEDYSIYAHGEKEYDCIYLDMYHLEEDDVQHQLDQPNDATETEELQVPTKENTRPYLLPCNTTTAGGRSTLKRKFLSFRDIRPTRPRNDVLPVRQIPELPTIPADSSDDEDQQSGIRDSSRANSKEQEEEAATIPISLPENGKEKAAGPGNDGVDNGASMPESGKHVNAVDDSCSLIVRAKYNDDFVRFPFSSNSGIEGLHQAVLKRFKLKVGSFKLKYMDDGYWIMLSCSEDLNFYMLSLKSSGQTTMDLSVFTTT